MDLAPETLIDIASLSQRLGNTLDRHVGHKTIESVDLDDLVVGSRTALEALNRTVFLRDGNADDRLTDWLKSDEPQECLRTLKRMDKILKGKVAWGGRSLFNAAWSTQMQDQVGEAIKLFREQKSYFHFLLRSDIWNRESGGRRPPPSTAQPDIDSAIDKNGAQQLPPSTIWPDVFHIDPASNENTAQLPPSSTVHVSHIDPASDEHGITTAAQSKDPHILGVAQAGEVRVMEKCKEVDLNKLDGVLTWLNAWRSRGMHERTILLRQPDTCTWLPETSEYKKWKSAEKSFLWLHGKPGAGKSVLAASVIEDLENTLQNDEVVAYFYCNFREERSVNAAEVLRSLLFQLLKQFRRRAVDPGDLLNRLAEERDEGASTMNNVTLLAGHISRTTDRFHSAPFLVIDALDECGDVEELLTALAKLREGRTRLFVVSRPLQIIKDGFLGLPSIDMETMKDEVSADIRLHVKREVDSHRRLRIVDPRLKEEIYSVLCEKAGGMFRWVQCQLNTLKRCVTMIEFREALNNLPGDLDETYGRILLAIDLTGQRGNVARHALDWLAVALEPLKLSEIMEGLSVDMKMHVLDRDSVPVHGTTLLDVLGSLVMYNEVTDIVILSHFSVKEYLIAEPTRKKYPAYHVDEQVAHTQLALLCLCYIGIVLGHHQRSSGHMHKVSLRDTYDLRMSPDSASTVEFRSGIRPSVSHPLLQYALSVGFSHLRYVNPRSNAILPAVKEFQLAVEQYPLEWDQLCGGHHLIPFYISECTSGHDIALYILIAFAPESLLRSFIGRTKLQPKDGTNPLIYAASFDKIEHARTLLSRGADVNRRGLYIGSSRQVLPLEAAVWQEDRDIVDLFLDQGSHVPHELIEEAFRPQSRRSPFTLRRTVSLRLMQTDEFVEWANSVREERVCSGWLLEEPSGVVTRRMLQIGYDPSALFCEAFLRRAASAWEPSAVNHIVLHNVSFPPDIILDASRGGNSFMIRLFLDLGYKVDVATPERDTPIHLLFMPYYQDDPLECLRVLVDAGCDLLACNSNGKTPMHLAATGGDVRVVDYLLSLQIPLPPDILFAAHDEAMVRSLIRRGASVHAIADDGDTPLHRILRGVSDSGGLLECVEILVKAGCDPRLSNTLGETAMDVAADRGFPSVVRYLLSIGVSLSSGVLRAAHDSSVALVRLLIDNGADVCALLPNGDTLLHVVISVGSSELECLEIVKDLVSAGCDPRARNSAGETPLHIAASCDRVSVMEYLLSLGISLPPDIMSPHIRPRSNRAIRFLLDNGCDPHVTSEDGDTLLHAAVGLWDEDEQDVLDLVRLLIDAGWEPFKMNSRHETPVHVAVRKGYTSIASYFLSLGMSLPADILFIASPAIIPYLINRGTNVSTVTVDGDTLLHLIVARYGVDEGELLECVKILVDAGCDPRARNKAGKTPLHGAIKYKYISVVDYLLSLDLPIPPDILLATDDPQVVRSLINAGADISAVTVDGDTPLHLSMASGDEDDCLERVKILVDAGCDPCARNKAGKTPLHVAAEHGYIPVVSYLLSLGPSIPPDILLAAPANLPQVIRYLVEEGADVSVVTVDSDTPLHLSIASGDEDDCLERVKILVDAGCDPRARNNARETPLHTAAKQGCNAVLEYFLARGVPLPDDILRVSTPSTIHFLSKTGADVCCSAAKVDMQLLHRALDYDYDEDCLKCAQTLISAGWDASLRNSAGETPIHIAARRRHVSTTKYLLSQGVSLPPDILFASEWTSKYSWRADSNSGLTVLFMCFLIRLGADVNVTKSNGDTPLHLALWSLANADYYDTYHWWRAIEALLDCGADPFARNMEGETPIDIAEGVGPFFKANFLRLVSNSRDRNRPGS